MQIRAQLRALSVALDPTSPLACGCTPSDQIASCRDGYHGKHTRIRHKARARHHGNEPGQSKQGKK